MAVPRNLKWYDTIAAIFVLLIISPPVALGQPTVGAFLICYLSSYMLQLAWFWKILKGVIALFSSDKPKPKRAAAPPV